MSAAGRRAEEYAVRVLLDLGYRINAVNYHTRYGEVDIVADNGEEICFVEVKARKRGASVSALESVTRSKQRKIITSALLFMQERTCALQPRFDVFAVSLDENGHITGHDYLEGAFSGAVYEESD